MLCSLFNFVLGLLGHLDVSAGHVDLGPPHHQALGRLVSYSQSHTQFIYTYPVRAGSGAHKEWFHIDIINILFLK